MQSLRRPSSAIDRRNDRRSRRSAWSSTPPYCLLNWHVQTVPRKSYRPCTSRQPSTHRRVRQPRGPDLGHPRVEHGVHRWHGRQRRVANPPSEARGNGSRSAVDRRGLHAVPGIAAARGRLAWRSLGTPVHVRARHSDLCRGLRRMRRRHERAVSDRGARRAGHRRGVARAGQSCPDLRALQQGDPRTRNRDLGWVHLDCCRHRADHRRLAGRGALVAMDFLHQHPARGPGDRHRAKSAREPERAGVRRHRLDRRGARDGWPLRSRVRPR